jgi:hypothetical protein
MPTYSFFQRQYRQIGTAAACIAQWWRSRSSVRKGLAQLCVDVEETSRMAHDVGLSHGELWELTKRAAAAADLLPKRMAALHLEPVIVAPRDLPVLRDMQRVCGLCRSKGRCMRDLVHDPNDPAWEKYCPNRATLNELKAGRIEPEHTAQIVGRAPDARA